MINILINKRNGLMSDINKAIQAIQSGKVDSVYLLHGTEYYFIEQFKNKLLETLKHDVDEDITTYDLQEVAIQEVLTDVETLPFFNEKKLIFANEPVFLKTKQDKLTVTHDLKSLEQYLNDPAPYSILVLVAPYEKLDERKKLTKLLKKEAVVVNCNSIKDAALRKWIQHIAGNYRIKLNEAACLRLEAEFHSNLYMMEKEIEKLALFVGEGGEVTQEIAENLISTSLNNNALQLVDAVLTKNLHEAIKIYKDLEKMKEDPIGLIALLAYQFRIIFQVKLLRKKGYPNQRIQSEVKVHPYVIKLASERSTQFSEKMLTNIMNELTNTDTTIKRGKMEKGMAFELLLYKLIAR